jgi:GntR family transcriptional regulator / MocR family aminotransferase
VNRSNVSADYWSTSGLDLLLEVSGPGRRAGLEEGLREAVRTGRLAAGTWLPSSRGLAADLGLSRGNVTAAYDQLVAEGWLVAHRGAGTQVASARPLFATATATATATAGAGGTPRSRPEPRLDLRPGKPDVGSFPVGPWLRATRRAVTRAPVEAFGYGDPRGRPELRTALADYLGRTRGVVADPDQVVVTNGYAHTLSLLGAALLATGRRGIAMEDPCLPYHREVVRRSGHPVYPICVDDLGLRPDLLTGPGAPPVTAVVTTAAHQYPTGVVLDPGRRRDLVRWAVATGGLVIEDDYDGEFRYDRQPVGALQATAPDHVAYAGTTSKTLAPGLRLGWVVLPRDLVDPVAQIRTYTDSSTSALAQLALADLVCTHAYDRHVRAGRLRYRRRRDLLIAELSHLKPYGHVLAERGIAAGLQMLVYLPPDGPREDEVIAAAAAEGLALEGLRAHFHSPREDHPHGVLVGFATPGDGAYPAAVSMLRRVLERGLRRQTRRPCAVAGSD